MCFRPADVSEMKQICKKCWGENSADAEVCEHCGAELKKMRPIPPASPGALSSPKAPVACDAQSIPSAPKVPGAPVDL